MAETKQRESTGSPPRAGPSILIMLAVAAASLGAFAFLLSRHQPKEGWLALGLGVVLLYTLPARLPGLRERAALKRAVQEAGRLLGSVRKALRHQSSRLSPASRQQLEQACAALETSAARDNREAIESATQQLDELADQLIKRRHPRLEYWLQVAGAVLFALTLRAFFYEAFRIPSGSMIPTLLVGDHLFVNKFVYGLRIPFTLTKLWARFPQRGDIVVFNRPGDESGDDVIKRVIGLPGETVVVRDGQVSICGGDGACTPLPVQPAGTVRQNEDGDSEAITGEGPFAPFQQFEEQVGDHRHRMQLREGLHPERTPFDETEGRWRTTWKVRPGHVFVMGDNRDNSQDSRFEPTVGGFGQVPVEHIKGRADIIWLSVGGPYGVRFERLLTLLK